MPEGTMGIFIIEFIKHFNVSEVLVAAVASLQNGMSYIGGM
jgi:hypothetical protein